MMHFAKVPTIFLLQTIDLGTKAILKEVLQDTDGDKDLQCWLTVQNSRKSLIATNMNQQFRAYLLRAQYKITNTICYCNER